MDHFSYFNVNYKFPLIERLKKVQLVYDLAVEYESGFDKLSVHAVETIRFLTSANANNLTSFKTRSTFQLIVKDKKTTLELARFIEDSENYWEIFDKEIFFHFLDGLIEEYIPLKWKLFTKN